PDDQAEREGGRRAQLVLQRAQERLRHELPGGMRRPVSHHGLDDELPRQPKRPHRVQLFGVRQAL
ncbi:unnamed protein product, partial [Ectocarpus sp. 13 AM-2016]